MSARIYNSIVKVLNLKEFDFVHLSRLALTNYRNYEYLDIRLPTGLIVFQGDNAQGKTNILEAVYLLSISKAYRAKSDRETINKNANGNLTQVLGVGHRNNDDIRILVNIHRQNTYNESPQTRIRKDIMINGVSKLASDLVGTLKTVLFDADDIRIITGSPMNRRRYLDIMICQLDRSYLRSLQRYQKILYQRNHLLKLLRDKKAKPYEIEFWNKELISEGSYITFTRNNVIDSVTSIAKNIHSQLTDSKEQLEIQYVSNLNLFNPSQNDIAMVFASALEDNIGKEISYGSSMLGPHRDDIVIKVGGLEASTYASRGQARTLALTLKLAEGEILTEDTGEKPILLLDDILSELDVFRRRKLLEHVSESQQAMLSTTDLDVIEPQHLAHASIYLVNSGNVNLL